MSAQDFRSPQNRARTDARACRVRVRFARKGAACGLSQLEQIRLMRKIASGSGLPCLTSGLGKSRVAKMSFGPAISVGYESDAEYADIYLAEPVQLESALEKLSGACESGFSAIGIKHIPLHFPSLESLVNVAEYEAAGDFSAAAVPLEEFLSRREIMIVKAKPTGVRETIDARPLIISMRLAAPGLLHLMLRFGPKRNLKPERIINAWLGAAEQDPPREWKITRKQLYWENSEGRLSAP